MEEVAAETLKGSGGNRLAWAELPAPVRRAVEERLGSAVTVADSQAGGFSPGLAARLRLADGRRVFAKAVSAERNPDSPGMHRREAVIAARLPATAPVPRLWWCHDDGDWVVLVFDDVAGRQPYLPWRPDERDRVLAALVGLAEAMTPAPVATESAAAAHAGIFTGWRKLAAAPDPRLAGLDPWALRRLELLVGWEDRWAGAAAGNTLLHSDLRADNILLAGDRVVFVDWPSACVGAAWADLVFMLPSMAMQGAGDPEEIVAAHPLTRSVDPDRVTAVLVALAGFFVFESLQPPPPGLPTVRGFQRAQGRVTLDWLRRRLA